MKRWVPYEQVLDKHIKDPKTAAAYLSACLEDGDWDAFLLALNDVARVHGGGISKLARLAKLDRVHMYRMLAKKGNPGMRNVMTLLRALGFKVTISLPAKLDRAA